MLKPALSFQRPVLAQHSAENEGAERVKTNANGNDLTPTDLFVRSAWPSLCQPILDALDEQPDNIREELWTAINAGQLSYKRLPDGRLEFSAGGRAFLRLESVGVMP